MAALLMASEPVYRRVILKLSGEVFGGRSGKGFDGGTLKRIAADIKPIVDMGVGVGIVVGGGNIFRGGRNDLKAIRRNTGDDIGMLGTVVNALAFRDFLIDIGISAEVLSAVDCPKMCERFTERKARRLLEQNCVLVFAGGTGNPYFTTDSAAALRACELDADLVLKGTNVDGVYSDDPNKNPKAKRYTRLTYKTCVEKRLAVMDVTAFDLCAARNIPFVIFDVRKKGNIKRAVLGENIGTFVGGE